MSVLGIDLGTSGIRAAVFAEDGALLAEASRRLELRRSPGGRVELDAADIIRSTEDAIAEVTGTGEVRADPPDALSFSVLGEAVVPVDRAGAPLAPVAVSMDTRGAPIAERLLERMSGAAYSAITGQPLHGMFAGFKIAAGGEGWEAAAGYRCMGDLLTQRWTGRAVVDYSMAARFGLFDVREREWSEEVMTALAVDAPWLRIDALPDPTPAGTVVAGLVHEHAERLGLAPGLPVVSGVHDQAAAYLGVGGSPTRRSVISFGSSDCVTVGTDDRPPTPDGTGFATYRVDDALWVTLAGTAAGGWVLEWFAGLLGSDVATVFATLSDAPPRLLFLPYLTGSGTLDNDPAARGAVIGLTLDSAVPETARAIIEASGFEIAKILAALRDAGVEPGVLAVTGSGVENPAAVAARADAAGEELHPADKNASVRGAATLAARVLGWDPSALAAVPPADQGVAPSPATSAWYAAQRASYVRLYEATRDIAHRLAETPTTT